MARPTVITKDVLLKLEYAFSIDCTDEEACIYAGISPSTLYLYQANNREFLERKALLKHTAILKARIALVEGMQANPHLALKYLERKKKDEFSSDSIRLSYPTLMTALPVGTQTGASEIAAKYEAELKELYSKHNQ